MLPVLRRLERADIREAQECLQRLGQAPQPSALCTFDVKNTFPGLTTNKSVNTLSVKPTEFDGEMGHSLCGSTESEEWRPFCGVQSREHKSYCNSNKPRCKILCIKCLVCLQCLEIQQSTARRIRLLTQRNRYTDPEHGQQISLWANDRPQDRARYGPALQSLICEGNVVGMLIDLRSSPGKISFTMDGENCGVAYDNVYTPVRPYVSLCLEQHQNGRQQCTLWKR